MTYGDFHLIFNLPAFLLLLWLVRKRLRRGHLICIGIVALVAFVATTPWDNWAVHRGIWGFDWDRTTPIEIAAFGETWRLPLEEYAYFIIETVMVGLLLILFLPRPGSAAKREGEVSS